MSKEITQDGRQQTAEYVARHAARMTRELADFIGEHIDKLAAPEQVQLFTELSQVAADKLQDLRRIVGRADEQKSSVPTP